MNLRQNIEFTLNVVSYAKDDVQRPKIAISIFLELDQTSHSKTTTREAEASQQSSLSLGKYVNVSFFSFL